MRRQATVNLNNSTTLYIDSVEVFISQCIIALRYFTVFMFMISLANPSSSSPTLPLVEAKITTPHLAEPPKRASAKLSNVQTVLKKRYSLAFPYDNSAIVVQREIQKCWNIENVNWTNYYDWPDSYVGRVTCLDPIIYSRPVS